MTILLTASLNTPQHDAVTTFSGPLLVLAGAGSGKTRVVTYRIAHMIETGIASTEILGLTFTNKAAGEMMERVRSITNQHVLISTFHSLGARILRESIHHLGYSQSFTIYDEEDCKKLLKVCITELKINDKKLDPKYFKRHISLAKNELIAPDEALFEDPWSEKVYALYQKKLLEYNAVDFDDLLVLPVKLFREHPDVLAYYQDRWKYLLIDEYQDTNAAQYELVQLLVAKTHNLCVVGDPDQSIYSWRGADISNILNFEKDYPGAKVIRLEQNYRSHATILEAANALIDYNPNRYDKKLWSDRGRGPLIKQYTSDTERGEAQFVIDRIQAHQEEDVVSLSEMVIFYRTNFQSRVFEDYLIRNRIPYVIVGGISFYQRREIKDILAFLRMVQSGSDYVSFERTINLPKRGIGQASIEKIRIASEEHGCSILEFCQLVIDGEVSLRLSAKQKEGLREYLEIINELKDVSKTESLMELIEETIRLSRYETHLMGDPDTRQDREANLGELVTKAEEWEGSTLESFLEELSLKSTLDEANTGEDRVSLMTIHNGKGLEFQLVFMAGMEQDLFPHANSREDPQAMEEERRLCYVGMTRAKEWLYMTHVRMRNLWGATRTQRPSQYFREIPSEYIEKVGGVMRGFSPKPKSKPKPDLFIDEVDQTVDEELAIGDAVLHAQFGTGVIRDVTENSMGLTYKIQFSTDSSEKSIVAKFAHLKKL